MVPTVKFSCRNFAHIIHSDYALALNRSLCRSFRINLFRRQTVLHGDASALMPRERGGADHSCAPDVPFSQIFVERHFGPPVARALSQFLNDESAHMR